MKLLSIFKKKSAGRNDGLIERYKSMRKTGLSLNMALVKQVPKPAVPECGKKLGIYKAGTLILSNEDEIAVLYDYCLHHYRRADKNVIQRYAEQSPPESGSDEALLLEALLSARYSLFRVEAVLPRQGVTLHDLLFGERLDLTDISLSDTAEPGLILAGRLLRLPEFIMSSGTLIPVSEPAYQAHLLPVIRKYQPDPEAPPKLSPSQAASFEAQIIRIALREGGEDPVFYTDVEH